MAQTTELIIQGRDNASKPIDGVAGALSRMKVAVETNRGAQNKLEGALKNTAASAAGLQGNIGRLAQSLLAFGPGGLVGGAVTAGIAAIIFAFKQKKEQQEQAIASSASLATALENQRLAYIKLTEGVEAYNKALIQSNLGAAKTALDTANANIVLHEQEMRQRAERRAAISETPAGFAGEAGGAATRGRQAITVEEALSQIRKEGKEKSKALLEASTTAGTALINLQQQQNAAAQAAAAASRKAEVQGEKDKAAEIIKLRTETKTEFDRLFELSTANGVQLSEQSSARLAELEQQYRNILNDTTANLEDRIVALKAIETVEKNQADERKRMFDERKTEFDKLLALSNAEVQLSEENKARLIELEQQYRNTLNDTNASLADRVVALQALATITSEQQKKQDAADKEAKNKAGEQAQEREELISRMSTGLEVMAVALVQGENAFQAFGRAAREAIVGELRNLAKKLKVQGLESLAKGYLAAANPLTAAQAPALFKSAATFFAGAAAAGVGASSLAAGGGGGGFGGRGGGFSTFNNSQLGRNNFNTQQPLTVVIQGGLLDMSNPETQRSFVGALETVTNRRVNFRGVTA